MKQTRAATEIAENDAWERQDDVVVATSKMGKALLRMEDTSTQMGKVDKRLAELHDETMENNELLERKNGGGHEGTVQNHRRNGQTEKWNCDKEEETVT